MAILDHSQRGPGIGQNGLSQDYMRHSGIRNLDEAMAMVDGRFIHLAMLCPQTVDEQWVKASLPGHHVCADTTSRHNLTAVFRKCMQGLLAAVAK